MECWERLESIRRGLAELKRAQGQETELPRSEWAERAERAQRCDGRRERLEEIQRKLGSSVRSFSTKEVEEPPGASPTWLDGSEWAGAGCGSPELHCKARPAQHPDTLDTRDATPQAAAGTPASRTLYESPCPSPPTPPHAPPEFDDAPPAAPPAHAPWTPEQRWEDPRPKSWTASDMPQEVLGPTFSGPSSWPPHPSVHPHPGGPSADSGDPMVTPPVTQVIHNPSHTSTPSTSGRPRSARRSGEGGTTSGAKPPPFRFGLQQCSSRAKPPRSQRWTSPFVAPVKREDLELTGQSFGRDGQGGDGESLTTLLGRQKGAPKMAESKESLWQAIELKVFLRRAGSDDLLGLLRNAYANLTLPGLLAIPEEEIMQLKGARPLALKRLVELLRRERRARSGPVRATAQVQPSRPGPASSMVAQLLQTGDRSSAVEAEVDWQSWERNDVKEPLQKDSLERPPRRPEAEVRAEGELQQPQGAEVFLTPQVPSECATQAQPGAPPTVSPDGRPGHLEDHQAPIPWSPWRTTQRPARPASAPDRATERPSPPERRTTPATARGGDDSPEGDHTANRPQTRRARIRELLKRLNLAQTPCTADMLRVGARQRQAKERHLRLAAAVGSSPSTGALSPALSLRRNRSFMELLASDATGADRTTPIDPSILEDVLARLPAKAAGSKREPYTICLEIPGSGEAVTTLPCCHWYHTECIREWLLHAQLCPLCKTSVVPEDLGT
ncbi:E3 ubiquitin-protein ligase MBR2 (HAL3-interacting protein 1 homolog) (AtHIP1) (MED25-binding RING-H2 protein 2) (RING-H2 finger MBR2) (RING-type E3 ubiquitin transferase MBR2) [Durusdinium trenchii]|uniref:E3 ubiquitin-protein ligase MBR2 (HAL3-interacting protein 1 homolog) (AtHIP1) (MED25-binding RING-H2 protein 2) (RING-H2 finger MBR2) (RING-type E3 ubiquitin transferase MBR2) n=1 Tax=Durusdinium trenchii TaxID=1381693 RepID=A0ABP0LEN4_9DINO